MRLQIARLVLIAALLAAVSPLAAQPAGKFPVPAQVGDAQRLGLGIQRTMTLLAESTPQKRRTVRVLFYGQSITEQEWWKPVADDLRRRFPHADLIIENRALGGFASQKLVRTAETDLYPFYPDLMIFYVYGSHVEYENIIRRTRERTTAEVLIQTDHLTADDQHAEETDPARLWPPSGKIWNSFMNYQFLPETVRKYDCGMVDQRNLWKAYLKANQLQARQLLKDGVHLNDHGNYLMAELVKAYLVRRDETRIDPMNCGAVRTLEVGKDVAWKDGKLSVAFEGNRVDVIFGPGGGAGAGRAAVRIDGRKPSEHPDLYGPTRALASPGGKWPVVAPIRFDKPPLLEDWTLQAKAQGGGKVYSFTVTGSKTGPDGSGQSDRKFVSTSGRVVIEPESWDVEFAMMLAGRRPPPGEFTVRWKVVPHFVDEPSPPAAGGGAGIEPAVTVAQGLGGGAHTLEISAPAPSAIAAIRIYRPPGARGN